MYEENNKSNYNADFILEFLDNNIPSSTECFKLLYFLLFLPLQVFPYSIAVRIPGFHPGGPGSTPVMGISIFDFESCK